MIRDYLYDWQQDIINKYKDRQRFGLFLDMGLGKTIISLGFAEEHKSERILIITLNSKCQEKVDVDGSWSYWLDKGGYEIAYKNYKSLPSNKYGFIVNYESLFVHSKNKKIAVELNDKINEFLKDCKNKTTTIILDESHRVKSTSSKISKAVDIIVNRINNPYIYLLSGTPFTRDFVDLHNQLKLLNYPLTKTQFLDNFCIRDNIPSLMGYQQPIVGYKNLNELYKIIHQYALTIKSEEVLNLPEKSYMYLKLPITNEFNLLTKEKIKTEILNKELKKRGMDELSGDKLEKNVFYRNLDFPKFDWLCETMSSFWLRTRQISIGFQGNEDNYIWYNRDRLNKLESFLSENEGNYILFYNFTPELLEIYEICEKLGYNIDVYCGLAKSEVFYNKYANQSEEERVVNNKNIILSNFASGSTGKNWQLYNKCIMFSLPVYRDYEQSLKRIHRNGQKHNVTYYIFMGNNWLDKDMFDSLNEKVEYNENLFKKKLLENL